jgi:hypothetical protein
MRDEDDNVLIGSVADLEERIDDGGWMETIEGARFPREVSPHLNFSMRAGGGEQCYRLCEVRRNSRRSPEKDVRSKNSPVIPWPTGVS